MLAWRFRRPRYGLRTTDDEGVMRQMRAVDDFPTREQLAAITAPTVALHGHRDQLIPFERGRELAASIPGTRLLILPGGGRPATRMPCRLRAREPRFPRREAVGEPVSATT
jgi:pimeloyl-ACP methyl ester carboxylesterase